MKDKRFQGGKKRKKYLTILLCSNADRSEKLKHLATGKLAWPRCFRSIPTLPSRYNKNA
jgi:hypothetical protein